MKTLPAIAAATAALMIAAPVLAAQEETRQITVQHHDLNLASAEGQRALERRLIDAAREVCGLDKQKTGSRIRTPEETQCFRVARAAAMQRYAVVVEHNQLGG